jgi:hypothetical protein
MMGNAHDIPEFWVFPCSWPYAFPLCVYVCVRAHVCVINTQTHATAIFYLQLSVAYKPKHFCLAMKYSTKIPWMHLLFNHEHIFLPAWCQEWSDVTRSDRKTCKPPLRIRHTHTHAHTHTIHTRRLCTHTASMQIGLFGTHTRTHNTLTASM